MGKGNNINNTSNAVTNGKKDNKTKTPDPINKSLDASATFFERLTATIPESYLTKRERDDNEPKPKEDSKKNQQKDTTKKQKGKEKVIEEADEEEQKEDQEDEDDDEPAEEDDDDELNISFGTFDFSSGKPVPTYLSNKQQKQNKKKKLAMFKQVMDQDKSKNPEEANDPDMDDDEGASQPETSNNENDSADPTAWQKAAAKAQGFKVKDDPRLIKKSLKREHKKKLKSKKLWEQRSEQVKLSKEERQRKRTENIAAHLQRKKDRKLGKKNKIQKRPGFEGKKKNFVNK